RRTSKLTPSTARTMPRSLAYCSFRSSTRSRTLLAILHCPQPWIEDAVERKAEHGEAEASQHQQDRRGRHPVVVAVIERALGLGIVEDLAPGGQDGIAQPQQRQRGLEEDEGGDEGHEGRDQDGQ